MNPLENCNLCPRDCGVNRLNSQLGFCGAGASVKLARVSLHHYEEPCISGQNGSGTVFFSNCSLRCVFCQNHQISQEGIGTEVTIEKLAKIFLELQNMKAHNINLVTPTHFVPQIIFAIKLSKKLGLTLPIIYNSSGYENLETIKMLKGYIDVYVPDLKYWSNKYAVKYSKVENYLSYTKVAIEEMFSQAPIINFNEAGLITKGVIIRHLMLPGLLFDSKKIIDYIENTYSNKVFISIMNQYTPMFKASSYPEIDKILNSDHYDALIDYALSKGITNGYIQDSGTSSKEFIPDFDLRGI
ncbi:MAG: radical SAM protein [Clostridiaceae bacterium]|nr:radical SAM protein [Clostridiaceae bacterium]